MSQTNREIILAGLEPMFRKAEAEGLWFVLRYAGLWFTPAELREFHKAGRFVWGSANWDLRAPAERITELEEAIRKLQTELEYINKRVAEGKS